AVAPEARLDVIAALPATVGPLVTALRRAEALLDAAVQLLDEPNVPRTFATLEMVAELRALLGQASPELLAFRLAAGEESDPLLDAAVARGQELRAERERLAQAFNLDLLPEVSTLEVHAAACATAGFFSFLS